MKKFFLCCLLTLCLCTAVHSACPHTGSHHSGCNHSHTHHGNRYSSHSSSSSGHVYVVNRDYSKTEQKFANCSKHYMVVETITYHYSDGSRRSFSNCTVYNADGAIIISDCRGVKHILYNNNHYFIISKNGYYLTDDKGNKITKKTYTSMKEFKPNRLVVRHNKKYGIIDLNENIIVPIKYQKFNVDGFGIFITKLNGYWGIVDSENNILVKNDCEKIKSLHDTILLKRYGKYGLADLNGKILYNIQYDKIKKLGEYILMRENKKYFVLDSDGNRINKSFYKKIKLERNTLYGLTNDKNWIEIKKSTTDDL